MKIAAFEAYQIDLPHPGGVYLLSGGREYRTFDAIIVRVVADDGADGRGESTPFGITVNRNVAGEPLATWRN
ncbi:MAG: hypothetical protein M5U35_06585 [Roseovarius sp.]|nr:hypothetical protein [Roseovarius sp.]